jgi:hypothetical protein
VTNSPSILNVESLGRQPLSEASPTSCRLPEREQISTQLVEIGVTTFAEQDGVSVRVPSVATVSNLQSSDAARDEMPLLGIRVTLTALELAESKRKAL